MFDFSTAHGCLRAAHIIPGFIGLAAFWVPVFAKKGGRVHIFFGWVFVVCAAIVILSAMSACVWGLVDPIGFAGREPKSEAGRSTMIAQIRFFTAFLGALAVYTLTPLWLAIRYTRTRKEPKQLCSSLTWPVLALQGLTGLALLGYSFWWTNDLGWSYIPGVFTGLGILGIYATWDQGKSIAWPPPEKMTWWYKHMEYMLTCGIAFHTAFLVFELDRFIGEYLQGPLAFLPWVLPSLIGVPATMIWVRYYRKRFKDE